MLDVHYLGITDYEPVWQAMRHFTSNRTPHTPDQIWLTEHTPVYTLGLAGDPAHLLKTTAAIPLIHCDRGGQITYHGPGQLIAYPLLDLRKLKLSVKTYVQLLENILIDTLHLCGIANAVRKPQAPGVYINIDQSLCKIAALGIKIKNGCAYHGLSLNVAMDLTAFDHINPCGYVGLRTIDMAGLGVKMTVDDVYPIFLDTLHNRLAIHPEPANSSRGV